MKEFRINDPLTKLVIHSKLEIMEMQGISFITEQNTKC